MSKSKVTKKKATSLDTIKVIKPETKAQARRMIKTAERMLKASGVKL